jgi:S1-C subfamily serine protease
VITAVAPGSPAAEAGLAAGDLITSLDGSPAVPERLADARYLLRSKPAGTSVPLSAERGTRLLKVTLKLRDLI